MSLAPSLQLCSIFFVIAFPVLNASFILSLCVTCLSLCEKMFLVKYYSFYFIIKFQLVTVIDQKQISEMSSSFSTSIGQLNADLSVSSWRFSTLFLSSFLKIFLYISLSLLYLQILCDIEGC